MADTYLEASGDHIDRTELRLPKTRELAEITANGSLPFVEFVECRRAEPDNREIVVFDVEVELGQRRVHDIHRHERVAVQFDPDDRETPETLALRDDFPLVPHLNLRPDEFPRSLCLFDEPYHETRLRWTPVWFIQRIRSWLKLTARGELHADDQPLEPLLASSPWTLVLPPDLKTAQHDEIELLALYPVPRDEHRGTLLAYRIDDAEHDQIPSWLATVVTAAPQPHGVIRQMPVHLSDLHEFLVVADVDLLEELRARLKSWRQQDETLTQARLVLIVLLPKTRETTDEIEDVEIRAFITRQSVAEIGQDIGIWATQDGHLAPLLEIDEDKIGSDVELIPANCTFQLSRQQAAALNGEPAEDSLNIVAVGMGTLGSQVFMNLMRSGYGTWTVIDNDYMQPHNFARHDLDGSYVGAYKARALAHRANVTFPSEEVATPIVADVLNPDNAAGDIDRAFDNAHLLLDMSASVPVSRYLARDVESPARRIALFLNPTASDLVLLAEDQQREIPLDLLEMQYYRQIVRDPELENHLAHGDAQIRYAQTCRDLSNTIPQDLVAMHAAIGSRTIRNAVSTSTAIIAVWQADLHNTTVSRIDIAAHESVQVRVGEWTLWTDQQLLRELGRLRAEKLPNETGGILIGTFDTTRKIVYVIDTIPSPPDSVEWPTIYIRGCRGLKDRVREVKALTGNMLGYVGEWHSHPSGHDCAPSIDDRTAFAWLKETMELEGYPPLMIIAAANEQYGYYLGQMQ